MPFPQQAAVSFIRDSIREYSARRLPFSFLKQQSEYDRCPEAILREILSPDMLGLSMLFIPGEYGGMELGLAGLCAACEELGRADLGIATGAMASMLAAIPIFESGTHEQKKRMSVRIREGALIGAFAATESHGGSSMAQLAAKASRFIKNGNAAYYRIIGAKQWITNAGIADFYVVLASAPGGPSFFILNKTSDGLKSGIHERKHGLNLSDTASLYIDNAEIPEKNLIGMEEGHGLAQAMRAFDISRIGVGAAALGAAETALAEAAAYGLARNGGNASAGSLADNPAYMNSLIIPFFARMEAVRFYLESLFLFSHLSAETAFSSGSIYGDAYAKLSAEAAIIKSFAAESCLEACSAAARACGGAGLSRDFPVGKRLADCRSLLIYEGPCEILKLSACRSRWQEMLKTGWNYYLSKAELIGSSAESGCDISSVSLKLLTEILAACRAHKLTRNKYASLKLGELISWAEMSAYFSFIAGGLSAKGDSIACQLSCLSASMPLDISGTQALARIFARQTLMKLFSEGSALLAGLSPEICGKLNLPDMNKILKLCEGNSSDFDVAAESIRKYVSGGGL